MFGKIFGIFSKDLGIDLGTANTLVYIHKEGIVINEPSVVAINQKTGQVLAIGADAKEGCGLSDADRGYYKSKFILYQVANNDYGGVQAYIVFVDKPDTIFWAWVYRLGGDGEYSLRGFCKAGPPDELKEEFTKTMKSIIERGKIKFSL